MSSNNTASQRSRWHITMLLIAAVLFFVSMTFPLFVPLLSPSLGPLLTSFVVFAVVIGGFSASIAAVISAIAGRHRRWFTAAGALVGIPLGTLLIYIEILVYSRGVLGFLWLVIGVIVLSIIGNVIDRARASSE